MDNPSNLLGKLFPKSSADDQVKVDEVATNTTEASTPATATGGVTKTVDADADVEHDTQVAPAVEHTHIKKEHETREQVAVEKEKHQDHYHTTIQPLKDSEVLPEKHDYTQETKHRQIDRDDGEASAKALADRAGFESTVDQAQSESKVQEPTQIDEHVHHHYHETVVPVIEKEVLDPSVTHKRIDVKEKIHEQSQYHGVTTKPAVDVSEFKKENDLVRE